MYYVYILTCDRNKIFYTGLTDGLLRRNAEHKLGINDGFTKRHRVHKLVYYEAVPDYTLAQQREKLIKRWKRSYKIRAIETMNPNWDDLALGEPDPAIRRG